MKHSADCFHKKNCILHQLHFLAFLSVLVNQLLNGILWIYYTALNNTNKSICILWHDIASDHTDYLASMAHSTNIFPVNVHMFTAQREHGLLLIMLRGRTECHLQWQLIFKTNSTLWSILCVIVSITDITNDLQNNGKLSTNNELLSCGHSQKSSSSKLNILN